MEPMQFVARPSHAGYGQGSRPTAVAEARATGADDVWPTLLDVIGGASGVERIVDRLVRRLLRDPLVAPSLDGVDMVGLKQAQARFFSEAFGAVRAHEPLTSITVRVNGDQFTRVVLHVHDTLASLDLSATVTEQLMLAVLKPGLVGADPTRLTRP